MKSFFRSPHSGEPGSTTGSGALNADREPIPMAWVWSHYKGTLDDSAIEAPLAWVLCPYSSFRSMPEASIPAQKVKKIGSNYLRAAAAGVIFVLVAIKHAYLQMKIYYFLAPVRSYLLLLLVNPKVFAKLFLMAGCLQTFSVIAPYSFPELKPTPDHGTPNFLFGYNLAAYNYYGHALSENILFRKKSSFDINEYASLFRTAKSAGAGVIKVGLFSGLQGIMIDESKSLSKGVSPELLKNLERILLLANYYNIKIYIGLFNGNDAFRGALEPSSLQSFFFNLFSKELDGLQLYEEKVLKPLLLFLNAFNSKHPETIYAIDLFSEFEGATHYGYFTDPWNDSRDWIKNLILFTKNLSPKLKFTVSEGWERPILEFLSGYSTDLGLDFYDIHTYSDSGHIKFLNFICAKVIKDNKPIILGEYGQISKTRSNELQRVSTANFLSSAKNSCFSAALGWHIGGYDDHLSYINHDGSLRPGAAVIRHFSEVR